MNARRAWPLALAALSLFAAACSHTGTDDRSISPSPSAIPGRTAPPDGNRSPGSRLDPSAYRDCAQNELAVTASTDRASYADRQPVEISVRIRNTGTSSCTIRTGSCVPQVVITDREGSTVWDRAGTQVVCTYSGAVVLTPNGTETQGVTWDGSHCSGRDPRRCPGGRVAKGSYEALVTWDGAKASPVAFTMTTG